MKLTEDQKNKLLAYLNSNMDMTLGELRVRLALMQTRQAKFVLRVLSVTEAFIELDGSRDIIRDKMRQCGFNLNTPQIPLITVRKVPEYRVTIFTQRVPIAVVPKHQILCP